MDQSLDLDDARTKAGAPSTLVVDALAPAAPVPLPVAALVVGHAEDQAEVDADRMADAALRRLVKAGDASGPRERRDPHRHDPGCGHLRRSAGSPAPEALVGREGGALDQETAAAIDSKRGGGRPIDGPVLERMQTAFSTDFSGVRIHDNPDAARLNRMVSARAFTTGKDIFFGAGEYAPTTPGGERVLAHELAHTMQREGHDGGSPARRLTLRRVAYGQAGPAADAVIRDAAIHTAIVEHNNNVELNGDLDDDEDWDEADLAPLEALRKRAAEAGLDLPLTAPVGSLKEADLLGLYQVPAPFAGRLAGLGTVTGLPGPLAGDSVKLPVDKNVQAWMEKAKIATGDDYVRWVDGWLRKFETLKARFADDPTTLAKFWNRALDETSTTFEPFAADDHGGVPPVKMTFADTQVDRGTPGKSVVVKSRPGEVDVLVTELFAAINALVPETRPLPEYKQAVFANGHLVSEFIDGVLPFDIGIRDGAADSDLGGALKQVRDLDMSPGAVKNFEWLQAVAKKIGLTDLHGDNVIWSQAQQKLVPIDLEAFDEGKATGLFRKEPQGTPWAGFKDQLADVPDRIEALLATFKEDRPKHPSRLVIIQTTDLLEDLNRSTPDKLSLKIAKELQTRRFTPKPDAILEYVVRCFDVKAVPSFLVQAGQVRTSPIDGEEWVLTGP